MRRITGSVLPHPSGRSPCSIARCRAATNSPQIGLRMARGLRGTLTRLRASLSTGGFLLKTGRPERMSGTSFTYDRGGLLVSGVQTIGTTLDTLGFGYDGNGTRTTWLIHRRRSTRPASTSAIGRPAPQRLNMG